MFSFIETRMFTRLVQNYLSDDEYREMQEALIENPEAGKVIRGTGGVRKFHWKAPGRGKSGGYRVIYYVAHAGGVFLDVKHVSKKCY